MSLTYMNNFYQDIYKVLINEHKVNSFTKDIYFNNASTSNYPFLVIIMVNVLKIANAMLDTYQLKFSISIYFREHDLEMITSLAETIRVILTEKQIDTTSYQILSMKFVTSDFQYSHDGISTKLNLNFLALIQSIIL